MGLMEEKRGMAHAHTLEATQVEVREMSSYRCTTCLDGGCEFCRPEPWPLETFLDLTDTDLEQLICDGLDELRRRGTVNARLETIWLL